MLRLYEKKAGHFCPAFVLATLLLGIAAVVRANHCSVAVGAR